jgi:murein DD-endopeptidase MepM/ murein hydrolase activator NlpD
VVVGLVAGLALLLKGYSLPLWEIQLDLGQSVAAAPTPAPTVVAERHAAPASGILVRSALAHTIIPDRPRLEVITHTVQPGDTVFGIADTYGISPETILWSNGDLELNPDMLSIGQDLAILPLSGVYHKVEKGDTLEGLAKKFKVESSAIADYPLNNLQAPYTLATAQMLVIPGGEKPYVPRRVSRYVGPIPEDASRGSGAFVWPCSGRITQIYWSLHRAIDIGAPIGSPVVASDSGYVMYAGWDTSGYGNLIIIDHRNGYRTLYAHLSAFSVKTGDSVGRGARVGSVGSTGNSTGAHLHFEIRRNEVQRNPIGFLPK